MDETLNKTKIMSTHYCCINQSVVIDMNNNEKESKDNLLSNEQQEFGGTILNKK